MTSHTSRLGLPQLGFGLGLRSVHYETILSEPPKIDWFEVLSDNYMHTRGRPLLLLDRIAERYPVALHGVGLSIGSTDPLDRGYLQELKALRDRVQALGLRSHLLDGGRRPLRSRSLSSAVHGGGAAPRGAARARGAGLSGRAPGAREPLHVPGVWRQHPERGGVHRGAAGRVRRRAAAGRQQRVRERAQHGFNPREYLRQLPLEHVVQLHVAGYSQAEGYLADTHGSPVAGPSGSCWRRRCAWARAPLLLERDADIPPLAELERELAEARACFARAA